MCVFRPFSTSQFPYSKKSSIKCYLQNREWTSEILLDQHCGSSVVKVATIVWSWEQRHQRTTVEEFVTVFNNLYFNKEKVKSWEHKINLKIGQALFLVIFYTMCYLIWRANILFSLNRKLSLFCAYNIIST